MKCIKVFSTAAALGLLTSTVFADPTSVNPRPRSSSMGHAGAAAQGSQDSASLNPAALSEVTASRFHFPILMEVPFDIGIYSDTLDLSDRLDAATTQEAKRVILEGYLRDVASMATSTRVNIYPSWTQKNLHIGLLADVYANPRFRVSGVASNQVIELGGSNGTAGLIVGGSYALMEDRLKVGLTLKPLYRVALTPNQEQTAFDIVKGKDPGNEIKDQIFGSDIAGIKGFGLGADLGVKYELPTVNEFRSSVGLTYQDIGDTRWLGDNSPRNIKQSVSLGGSVQKDFKFTQNTFLVDFRNITEEQDFLNKLHFGAESVLWRILALRAGMSQLYWTAGLGLNLRFFEMDFYATAREAGEAAHIQEDRALGLRISMAI